MSHKGAVQGRRQHCIDCERRQFVICAMKVAAALLTRACFAQADEELRNLHANP
jgi:hypothetical protein